MNLRVVGLSLLFTALVVGLAMIAWAVALVLTAPPSILQVGPPI